MLLSQTRTTEVRSRVRYQKNKPRCIACGSFSTTFPYKWAGNVSVYSMKSIFWTNEKLFLMVAWSSSVSISCFKAQSSIGHLVLFFTRPRQKASSLLEEILCVCLSVCVSVRNHFFLLRIFNNLMI